MLKKSFISTFFFNFLAVVWCAAPVYAAGPGRGDNAELERAYLRQIIDHHFAGLRMTELAAGTLEEVTGDIFPDDRTRPTPGFEEGTEPRAALDEIKSLARKDNRLQREEILKAQKFLREWYGETHQPNLTSGMREEIDRLQGTEGEDFDKLFLEIFAHHHYEGVVASVDCLSGYDLEHHALHRYCEGIVNNQLGEIDEMRDIACHHYDICDIQAQRHNESQGHGDRMGGVNQRRTALKGSAISLRGK
jgi:uncharacterized protein (DUF305 family)